MKKILFLIFTVYFFSCFIQVKSVLAKEKIGLSVDQSALAFDIFPGESQNLKLVLKNISDRKEIIKIGVADIEIGDDNKIVILNNENPKEGMKNWIRMNEKDFILNSGESRDLFFSVNIPQNAGIGSHYSDIIFQSFPEIDFSNSQRTLVSGRLAVHILVNVKGDISGKGKISKVEIPTFVGEKEIEIKSEFQNLGNIHYVPHGKIEFQNILTGFREVEKTEKHFVFPKKKYTFKSKKNTNPFFGFYKLKVYFVDGDGEVHFYKKYIMGKYFIIFISFFILIMTLLFFYRRRMKRI